MSEQIRLKRIYDPAEPGDGYRVLVDRVWPRGVRKADAALDEWMKDLAPSRNCASGSAMTLNAGKISVRPIRQSWRSTRNSWRRSWRCFVIKP